MRKSGWAAAAGLMSAALLLTACGGSSSSTGATGGNSPGGGATSASGGSTSPSGGSTPTTGLNSTNSPGSGSKTPNPKSSSSLFSPPPGAVYFTVKRTVDGWVLAESGKVVYTYAGDTKGQASNCSGGCAAAWPAVKGTDPLTASGFTIPGTFGVSNGQVTYNGLPLYTKAGAMGLSVYPSAQWHLVKLSGSDVQS